MSGILTKTAIVAGALYGYTPDNRKSTSDIVKFTAIISPLAILRTWASTPNPTPMATLVPLVASPMMIGWCFCVGSQVGKFGRNAVNEDA